MASGGVPAPESAESSSGVWVSLTIENLRRASRKVSSLFPSSPGRASPGRSASSAQRPSISGDAPAGPLRFRVELVPRSPDAVAVPQPGDNPAAHRASVVMGGPIPSAALEEPPAAAGMAGEVAVAGGAAVRWLAR